MKSFMAFLAESKHYACPHLLKDPNLTFSELRAFMNNLFTCNFAISDTLVEDEELVKATKEISDQTRAAIRESKDPKEALAESLEALDKLATKVGYGSTVNDFIHDAFARKIVKCASENGLDIKKDSLFVDELANRLNLFGFKNRPTKTDLATFAKREGVKPNTDQYKSFLAALDETMEVANQEITKPIEEMLINCAILASKVLQLPACLDESKEAKDFCKCCNSFYKNYCDKKFEINDNAIGDVREFLTNIKDYVEHAKAMDKLTFKLGSKMYRLSSTMPNIDCFKDIVDF